MNITATWTRDRVKHCMSKSMPCSPTPRAGSRLWTGRKAESIFSTMMKVVAYQDTEELGAALEHKVSNMVLIVAERTREGRDEFFLYSEAFLLGQADLHRLLELIENGAIIFHWRMHLRPNGTVRDHGAAYRIKQSRLPELYSRVERLV